MVSFSRQVLPLVALAALGVTLWACRTATVEQQSDSTEGTLPTNVEAALEPNSGSSAPLKLGDWEQYPKVDGDAKWPSKPLDESRWAMVSAELGCVGRRSHGDPDAHRERVLRIVQHYRTSPEDVMSYGIRLNRDRPETARNLGRLVAEAMQTCR